MADIHDYSPKRDNNTFHIYTKSFDFPFTEVALNRIVEFRQHQAIEAGLSIGRKAMEEGKLQFTLQKQRDGGEHHLVQGIFIHPDDFYSLTRDIGALEGGHEIIKKYF